MRARALPGLWAVVVLGATYRYLGEGVVQAAKDLAGHDFPETWYLVERWRQGELPLWWPHVRLGQPFLATMYTQVLYAPRVVTGLLFGHVLGPNVLHLLHAAWGFAGGFLAARRLGLPRWPAFAAAAPFFLSPFYVELAQNLSFASTAAWAGWVLWAAEGVRRQGDSRAAATLAAMLGAAFLAGAPELWLWEAALALGVAGLRWGVAAAGAAVGLAAVVALPAAELSWVYTRPGEATAGLTEWSLSWAQLLSIGVPDGDLPRAGPYWGGADQRFLFTLFIGSVGSLLAVVGATVRRARPLVWLAAGCLLLALGKHFVASEWLLHLPPLRLFRYPVKYGVGLLFALSVLAGFGARRLAAGWRRRSWALSAALPGLALGLWAASRLASAREGLHEGAPWLVGAAALTLAVGRWPMALASLVALELMVAPVARWERAPRAALEVPSPVAAQLRAQGVQRVSIRVDLDDVEHEACGPWDEEQGEQSRRRLSALRFVEEDLRAVTGYGFRDPWRLGEAFRRGAGAWAAAGVSHFVRETWARAPVPGASPTPSPVEDLWIWSWPSARPRAWFVSTVRVGGDAEAFAALRDVASVRDAVVVERGEALVQPPCDAPVAVAEPRPEVVTLDVDACAAGAVVLGDAWYPGWDVFVDGAPAEGLRAWGFLRAVRVSPGRHTIEWRYRPRSVAAGAGLSLASLALLGLAWRRRWR